MYRGRPPPRGGDPPYPPPYEGRGPPPPRSYPAAGYRDDRSRARAPYQHDYHNHGYPDSYRRSPPRRRYPSPGSGGHRGAEYWASGPPREVSGPGSEAASLLWVAAEERRYWGAVPISSRSAFVSSRRAKRLQKAARRAALRPLLKRHTRRPLVCPSDRCVCVCVQTQRFFCVLAFRPHANTVLGR